MKRLRIENEGKSERIIWKEILRSRESRIQHRLHGVLAVCRGLSCYETAAVWGRSPRAVEYWVKRFSDDGIEGLSERQRSGRRGALSAQQRDLLIGDIARTPSALGLDGERWSGARLKRLLKEYYGVELGLRQCQRLLQELRSNSNSKNLNAQN